MPKVEENLDEPGIYRISGNASVIQRFVIVANAGTFRNFLFLLLIICILHFPLNSFNKSTSMFLDSTKINFVGEDVHVACGLLKLYFRELSEPIFLDRLYAEFVSAGRMQVFM